MNEAADDPHVLAIKQCLYRTSGDSPVVAALVRAAERGKQVAVLVEVTARFDEEANIGWARALEEAGAHVIYGLMGLKTHAKTTLVVRQEGDAVRLYCHVGTGNYNPKTARMYEDLGVLSSRPALGADVTRFFNYITGFSQPPHYQELVTSPGGIRDRVVELHRRGGRGRTRRPDRDQGERPRRRGRDRRPLPGLAGRRAHRSDHPGHLLPAPGGAGTVGDHPGPLHRRAVPRALADPPLRRRRRSPGQLLHRLGRPPQAEPRPAGRGDDPGGRPRRGGCNSRRSSTLNLADDVQSWSLAADGTLAPDPDGGRRRHPGGPRGGRPGAQLPARRHPTGPRR